jgi:hypothetical protein
MPAHEREIRDAISERLARLDTSLFERISSQTSENDGRSLPAIQEAVRERGPSYAYLEIGSHFGDTIQSFLRDDRCTCVFSIDRRPLKQPDAREVDPAAVAPKPAICFVDGEHTDGAPAIARMLVHNHTGYLASLWTNDHYRRFYNCRTFRIIRRFKAALRRVVSRTA